LIILIYQMRNHLILHLIDTLGIKYEEGSNGYSI